MPYTPGVTLPPAGGALLSDTLEAVAEDAYDQAVADAATAASSALTTHTADTTSVHGIADTSLVVVSSDIDEVWVGTQSEYDAIGSPDAETLYVITDTVGSARVYRNTTQNIAASTLTKLSYTTERWDDGTLWAAGAPTRMTVPVAGLWKFGACMQWSTVNTVGDRYADFFLNNTTIIGELSAGWGLTSTSGADGQPFHEGETLWKCAAGDYVEVRVYQSSGSALDLFAGSASEANLNDFYAYPVKI